MAFLLDTHALYWLMFDNNKLAKSARHLLSDPPEEVFVSKVSLWEFSIKSGLGKLELPKNFFLTFDPQSKGASLLSISSRHLETYRTLPLHHRDPFDRMLVAQAVTEGLTIITRDPDIRRYAVATMEA